MRLKAIRKACEAMRTTSGIAAAVENFGGTRRQNQAVEAAIANMVCAVGYERDARRVLAEANFPPRAIDATIRTMREGLTTERLLEDV